MVASKKSAVGATRRTPITTDHALSSLQVEVRRCFAPKAYKTIRRLDRALYLFPPETLSRPRPARITHPRFRPQIPSKRYPHGCVRRWKRRRPHAPSGACATKNRPHGRLPFLNRHSLCRRQKIRNHRAATPRHFAIRIQPVFQRTGEARPEPRRRADPHPCERLGRPLRRPAQTVLRASTRGTLSRHHLGKRARAF